jgi:para-aminobenzoate synthetase component 1
MLSHDTLYLHAYELPKAEQKPLYESFKTLVNSQYALLLDSSVESGDKTSQSTRFSIMLWAPHTVITSEHHRTIVQSVADKTKRISREDPIELADEFIAQLKQQIQPVTEAHSDFPFQCGVAGLIGYDMARFYGQIEPKKQSYRSPDLIIGLYCQALIHCHETDRQVLFYLHKTAQPLVRPLSLIPKNHQSIASFSLTSPWHSNLSESDYLNVIARIHSYLTEGDCYQCNFSQRFEASYSGSPYSAYLSLRQTNKAPFSAYMVTHQGAVLSVSPERFLSVNNKHVETKPIKGTRPRSDDPQKDRDSANALLNSEKDRAENLMIVDLLRNDLSKHCLADSVKVPHLFALESYTAVHHMVSTVTGTLNNTSSPLQLLKDAFPGGSITGAPKIRAMEIIDELEPHSRNIYCGSIFYNGWRDDLDSSICIRTILAEQGTVYCCAGGGIVIDSIGTQEYQETFDKVTKILPVLGSYEES